MNSPNIISIPSPNIIEVEPGSRQHPVTLSTVGFARTLPCWLTPVSLSDTQFLVDPDSLCLLRRGWRAGAEWITRRPPGRPALDSRNPHFGIVREFWPDWLRILTYLAIREAPRIEEWSAAILLGTQDEGFDAFQDLIKYWSQEHPLDHRNLMFRLAGRIAHLADTSVGPPADQDPKPLSSLGRNSAGFDAIAALSCALAWQKDFSTDGRSGLAEQRWVAWPSLDNPRLILRIVRTKFQAPAPIPAANAASPNGKPATPSPVSLAAVAALVQPTSHHARPIGSHTS